MATEITLPSLGENIDSGDVLSILVSEGDSVTKDQDLMEIETDKATAAVPSPSAGTIIKILVAEGDTVNVGAPIFEIDGSAAPAPPKEEPKPAPKAEEPKPEPAAEPAPAPAAPAPVAETPAPAPATPAPAAPAKESAQNIPGDGQASSAAGPSVRRLARELGIDLRRVRPSSGGRLTEEDVRSFVRDEQEKAKQAASASVTPPGSPNSDGQGAVRIEKMSRTRKTIAANMVASYTTIPQLTNFDDVDVTELEEMRRQSKEDYAKRGLNLSQMPFLVKAIASSLKLHPIVNASVDMDAGNVIYKEYVNIGIAVDTESGLRVPVLRDADRLSISQIARELDRIILAAREGTLSIEDMRGGTFTISNMGAVGGTYSTPIINPPEVGILLVGRSRMLPTIVGSSIEPRLIMPLSLTYDHRVVDGADAARFLNEVKGFLGAPGRLLLAP
ncbi:2-oxo acid dehydrogenase subunit E2 [Aeoliella mucimassa]|uniref:Dihydrolipoamide acetyltransferase component of pyruvate dehydrogenase complex n=1 Tax=Aeoliella mucimassa TaxID=2527972 RepID=A0A518AID7_9BACT|nr:2-oxo acid dehydrogenase subunit E2 [Aeoliella mucimassa]QDU54501.1 Dihydrolipoyllysine-residue acetyltransferase component of pyruvate dehydrogenase complex [Aeoliella mucimassa]